MPIQVRITPSALAELTGLHEPMVSRINRAMERLADWPIVSGAKPLRGGLKGHFRIRVGDWRIIFIVAADSIVVVRIANRRDVYGE